MKEKIKTLKKMNDFIIGCGDESIWLDWIAGGVPDAASESDYEWIAGNDDEYKEVCEFFHKLKKEVEENECE